MSPVSFLLLAAGVTLLACAVQWITQRQRRRRLRRLAKDHSMHFCHGDRFHFAPKVAEHFPIPGAADVRVHDLFYCSRDDVHRYVFTVEYTRGVVRTKSRHRRVAAFVEPRGQRHHKLDLRLAENPALPVADQYHTLCQYVLSRHSNHAPAS